MKKAFFLGLAALSSTIVVAQNTTTINQQGSSHAISVEQQGTGNTSVVNQTQSVSPNSIVISQSGSGNVATVNQGGRPTSSADTQTTVITSQSGEGETIINRTKDGNTISIYQSGPTDNSRRQERKRLKN